MRAVSKGVGRHIFQRGGLVIEDKTEAVSGIDGLVFIEILIGEIREIRPKVKSPEAV